MGAHVARLEKAMGGRRRRFAALLPHLRAHRDLLRGDGDESGAQAVDRLIEQMVRVVFLSRPGRTPQHRGSQRRN
jgi:hypothetical protein